MAYPCCYVCKKEMREQEAKEARTILNQYSNELKERLHRIMMHLAGGKEGVRNFEHPYLVCKGCLQTAIANLFGW